MIAQFETKREEKKKTHYIMRYRIMQNVNICLIGITEQYRQERAKERFEKVMAKDFYKY